MPNIFAYLLVVLLHFWWLFFEYPLQRFMLFSFISPYMFYCRRTKRRYAIILKNSYFQIMSFTFHYFAFNVHNYYTRVCFLLICEFFKWNMAIEINYLFTNFNYGIRYKYFAYRTCIVLHFLYLFTWHTLVNLNEFSYWSCFFFLKSNFYISLNTQSNYNFFNIILVFNK